MEIASGRKTTIKSWL